MNAIRINGSGHVCLNSDWYFLEYTRADLAAFEALPLQLLHTLLGILENLIVRYLQRECANPDQRWEEALAAAATHTALAGIAPHRFCMNFDLLRIIVLKKEQAEIAALTGRAA